MNIFYLDEYPTLAANYHSDTHIIKMSVELTQILMTNFHVLNGFTRKKDFTDEYISNNFHDFPRRDENNNPKPYGVTHVNHPSTVWARECTQNYLYTYRLAKKLCAEYYRRYRKEHACLPILKWILYKMPFIMFKLKHNESDNITPPALAMPKELHDEDYVNTLLNSVNSEITDIKEVNAYRAYYIFYKKDINVWRHSDKPFWYPAIELINENLKILENVN